ncbi:putative integral membrane protein [Desulfitobacterium dichloroeliminans LMG P-21439]|uniref:Putative integral membrane protein n=1 Tax=Desulfitobacterium dichloroeliminans (strain LMG P-21439 / DCA1) TaxID=871963 RepID=L0FCA3_DESDL|nr:SdpI family protein [Desulfitobacterium dichloroeliminans]AGA70635.1 putative integral membrane protein [Desulfitobacterium dichloroeliminans LMG P-21439]
MENINQNRGGRIAKILSGLFVLINIIVGVWAHPKLPDQVPSHWNIQGQVDGYTNAFWGAYLFPLLILGVYLLFWALPKIDPKRANYQQMGRVFWIVGLTLVVFLSFMYWGTIAIALGYLETLPRWYFSGIGVLFILMGNYFGKIKYNYTFGIRTPWTLANEEVWLKTHRFAGPIWIVGGIIMCLTGFAPPSWTATLFGIVMALIAIVPMAYSYIVHRKIVG